MRSFQVDDPHPVDGHDHQFYVVGQALPRCQDSTPGHYSGSRMNEVVRARRGGIDCPSYLMGHIPHPTVTVLQLRYVRYAGASHNLDRTADDQFHRNRVVGGDIIGFIRQAIGDPDLKVHDLRRTVASWMTNYEGRDLSAVGRTLNHKSLQTTHKVYAQVSREALEEPLTAHGKALAEVLPFNREAS